MHELRKRGSQSTATKDEVIHIRTSPTDKFLIEKAADSLGLSASSFILQHSIKAARRELAEIESLSLTNNDDAQIFLSALMNPPAPNDALKKAFRTYEKKTKK